MLRHSFKKDLQQCFELLGVNQSTDVVVHSDAIITAGYEGNIYENLEILFNTLIDKITHKRNLFVPSFSMSYTKGEFYDVINSPGSVGMVSEYFRSMTGVLRSQDPIYNFCLLGKDAKVLSCIRPKTCFGPDTIFNQIHKNNALMLFLGCSLDRATFVHYVEEMRGVSYRYFKEFSGTTYMENRKIDNSIDLYVRDLELDTIPNHKTLRNHLKGTNRLKTSRIGRFSCIGVFAKDFSDAANELLDSNEYALINEGVIKYGGTYGYD